MERKDLLLGSAIALLLIVTLVLALRTSTLSARESAAYEMSGALTAFLQEQDAHIIEPYCRNIGAGRYEEIQACLGLLADQSELTNVFSEDGFRNYDTRRNESGYVVVANARGAATFESDRFTLSFNNEVVANGCTTAGEIRPGYTCRLDFNRSCMPGDNLEVSYDKKRAHLRTC